LGKTGESLSVAGCGGINYFDVGPSCDNAEVLVVPALKPYLKDIFLAGKTGERTADKARQELQQSLQLLHSDYLDLYQMHGLITYGRGRHHYREE